MTRMHQIRDEWGSDPFGTDRNHFAPSAEVPEWELVLFIALPMMPLDSVATRLRNAE